jgi:hypothetical protein
MSRYDGRKIYLNDDDFYEEMFEERGVNSIRHYATPTLDHPSAEQVSSLNTIPHVWKTGDRYYKLAHDHYGDSRNWWIIAWFNKLPTEASIKYGDVIYIPHPLDRILNYLGV